MNIINDYKQLRIIESLNATTKLAKENKKLKEKLEKIEKVILRCKVANCTNCEYQDKCNLNGDDFDDYKLKKHLELVAITSKIKGKNTKNG